MATSAIGKSLSCQLVELDNTMQSTSLFDWVPELRNHIYKLIAAEDVAVLVGAAADSHPSQLTVLFDLVPELHNDVHEPVTARNVAVLAGAAADSHYMQSTVFSKLAPELRNHVYKLVAAEDEPILLGAAGRSHFMPALCELCDDNPIGEPTLMLPRLRLPGLTGACKMLRTEALLAVFTHNTFKATLFTDNWDKCWNNCLDLDRIVHHLSQIQVGDHTALSAMRLLEFELVSIGRYSLKSEKQFKFILPVIHLFARLARLGMPVDKVVFTVDKNPSAVTPEENAIKAMLANIWQGVHRHQSRHLDLVVAHIMLEWHGKRFTLIEDDFAAPLVSSVSLRLVTSYPD